jgi:hypothetical protein
MGGFEGGGDGDGGDYMAFGRGGEEVEGRYKIF